MPRAVPQLSICAFVLAVYGAARAQLPLGPHEIRWAADRPLSWEDFQGAVDRSARPEHVAMTAASLGWGYELALEWGGRSCVYRIAALETQAVFDASESWVRPGQATATVLEHEQGHFDIAQIYKLRLDERARELIGAPGACEGASPETALEYADEIVNERLAGLADAVWQEFLAVQDDYDDCTEHGIRIDAQRRWTKRIADALRGAPWRAPGAALD